jgi:3',5'-cyclic AMP phosphodiesterase CpdA
MRVTHTWDHENATIRVEGLTQPVRICHLTDPHTVHVDDRDPDYVESTREVCETFAHRNDTFTRMMASTDLLDLDLIALTGDLTNFPSLATIDFINEVVGRARTRCVFTGGNHDSTFPGEQCTAENRRAWWPRWDSVFPGNRAFSRHELGELQLLLVDNANYQVDDEQLAFLTSHLSSEQPTVLLSHIPISLPTLRPSVMANLDNRPLLVADPDWSEDGRAAVGNIPDTAATFEFVRIVTESKHLAASLCGHVHLPHADALNTRAVQYVGGPVFDGYSRVFEFQPL